MPSEVCQLTTLQELYLSDNQLSQLPPEIGQLTTLQSLNLSNNQLSQLPSELWQLTNLQELALGGNHLRQLPAEIEKLTNLQKLWIWGFKLSQLPSELCQLTTLQSLNLSYNQLSQLPPEIVQLTTLQSLDLSGNQLSQLPPEIVQLTTLQSLNLSYNQLSQLPPEIGQLTTLQSLNLSYNQLSQLPPEIGQLTTLQSLNLSGNQLSQLPPEIGQLTNLRGSDFSSGLDLRNNQLSQLPPEIGQLTTLQVLDLRNNQLSQLPPEIGQLTNLLKLDVEGNTNLLTPPPEIVARGTVDMLAFLRELQKSSITRYESKLLVIGEGGTGKSSLLRALHKYEFNPNLSTTHGIEVDHLKLSHPHHDIVLNTWDFGGQQIYHATHQFFLTKRSLYILVWNARLGSEQGRLHYWLDTIKALAPDAPVLLVATHIDERSPDLNYQLYKDAYPQLIGNLSVSSKNKTGLDELKTTIANEALKLPLMGQPWPQQWLAVEEALLSLSDYHIDAERYINICMSCKVDPDIVKGSLGNYLHDLGKILYFRDDFVLSNLVVLKPNWVTKAISRVLDDDAIGLAKGILHHSELPRIWTFDENGQRYEQYLYPVFLRLMERFDLSYQIEADIPSLNSTSSLIPQLLPHQPPITLPPWPRDLSENQSQVEMVYRLDFIPAGIMSRFIVRSHRYTKKLHWREGVLLEYQGHQSRVELNPMTRELRLLVQGPLPQNFFTILMNTVDTILDRFKGLVVRREIPCICHHERGATEVCSRYYRYEDLVHRMEVGRQIIECPDTFVEVSVPMLLYGIHRSTNEKVMADIKQGQQEIHKKLADLQKLDIILEKMDQQSELIGRNFTRQWNLEMEKMEAECPNTFVLMPGSGNRFNPKNWVSQEYRLLLICQHPPKPHPVKSSYPLRQAEEWWVTVSPWLGHLIKFLKFGIPIGKAIGAVYDEIEIKHMQTNIDLLEEIVKSFPDVAVLDSMDRSTTTPILQRDQETMGPALRALHSYLNSVDPHKIWGGLHKTLTPDGHILWLCNLHRQQYEAKPLQLDAYHTN